MMARNALISLFVLCLAASAVQAATFSFQSFNGQNFQAGTRTTILVSCAPGLTNVRLVPVPSTYYTLNPIDFAAAGTTTVSFEFVAGNTAQNGITIGWSVEGADSGSYATPSQIVNIVLRQITFTGGYQTYPPTATTYVGVPTDSFAINLAAYPASNIVVTPVSSPPGVVFTPASFTFTSTRESLPFYFQSSISGTFTVTWQVTGADAALYVSNTQHTLSASMRSFIPSPALLSLSSVVVGADSQTMRVSVNYPPPTGVTLTPRANDVVFTPSSLTFTPTTDSAQFSLKSSVTGARSIAWTVEGNDQAWYATPMPLGVTFTARTFSVVYPATTTYIVGQTTEAITVSTQFAPSSQVVLTLSASAAGCPYAPPTLSTTTLTFTPTQLSQTFTVKSNGACSVSVSASLSGADSALYTAPAFAAIPFNKLTLTTTSVDPDFTLGTSALKCGDDTQLALTVSSPPPAGFSVQFTAPGAVFSPALLAFSPTVVTVPFNVTSTYAAGTITIHGQVIGTDSALVNTFANQVVDVDQKIVTVPTGATYVTPGKTSLFAGTTSDPLQFRLNFAPSSSLTITPTATGLTFSPATLTFARGETSKTFTVTASGSGAYTVYYTLSGADAGCYVLSASSVSVSVAKLVAQITPASSALTVGTWSTPYTVTIDRLPGDVTLTPVITDATGNQVAGVQFQPATLPLTKASPSASFTFRVASIRPASDRIVFKVSGTVSAYVNTYTAAAATTDYRTFKLPPYLTSTGASPFAGAQFVAGVASQQLVVRVEDAPVSSVSLRPVAPNTVFTPAVLTFDANTKAQTFTVTTLNGAGSSISTDGIVRQIDWTVEGADSALYSTPAPSSFLAIKRRIIVSSAGTITAQPVYVGTAVSFSITTPYAPATALTITPSGGAFTFNPATITIEAGATVGVFTATPTAVGNSRPIKFVISGDDANSYADLATVSLNVRKADFDITTPALGSLTYGVASLPFNIRAVVAPTTDVVVTAYSQQVVISPNTFTFTPTATVTPFTITAIPSAFATNAATQSEGGVSIEFVVSGTDAALFSQPAPITFTATVSAPPRALTFRPASLTVPIARDITFFVSTTVPPTTSVTLTPSVPNDPDYTFTPASQTITPTAPTASFTVRRNTYPRVGSATIVFGVSGTDAYLYANNNGLTITAPVGTITSKLVSSTALTAGKRASIAVTLSEAPSASLTVEPYVVSGQPITFAPTQVTFAAGITTAAFSMTPTSQGASRVAYRVTGDAAKEYAFIDPVDVNIAPGTITLSQQFTTFAFGGETRTFTLSLNTPTANGLTVTPAAAGGLTFSPAVITFPAGSASASFQATATASGLSSFVSFVLGGTDAGIYTNPCANKQCTLSSATPSVSATAAAIGGRSLVQRITFTLTRAHPLPLTITPSAPGVTFSPSTVTVAGATTAVVDAYATVPGTVNIYYSISGDAAPFFVVDNTLATSSIVAATFDAYTVTVRTPESVPVGATSAPIAITVPAHTGPVALAPIRITPVSNNANVVFTPSNVTIDTSASKLSGEFTYRSTVPGGFSISYVISGDGAAAYLPIAATSVNVELASFTIPAIQSLITATASNIFIYGIKSHEYTVYCRNVPSEVTLQLVSDSFDFEPTELRFNPSTNQASFAVVPKKVGPAVISFNVVTPAGTPFSYVRPDSVTNLRVTYQVAFPILPTLAVGVTSEPQTVTITPTPASSFTIDLGATGVGIVFSPAKLVFTPGANTASFRVTPRAPTMSRPNGVHIPGLQAGTSVIQSTTTALTVNGQDSTDATAYAVPLVNPVGIIVAPGYFSLKHPRYQLDIKTKIEVSISTPPRSDVVLSLFGNNMLFETNYVVFTRDGPVTQEIEVTPRHTTSYELDYESFKVDYQLSGTNAGDYITPSESNHYVAIPMGYIAAIVLVPIAAIVLVVVGVILFKKFGPKKSSSTTVGAHGNV